MDFLFSNEPRKSSIEKRKFNRISFLLKSQIKCLNLIYEKKFFLIEILKSTPKIQQRFSTEIQSLN